MRAMLSVVIGVVLCLGAAEGVSAQDLLFVVRNASSLEAEDTAHKALFESWGWDVTLISQSASQAQFDVGVRQSNVAYITENVDSGTLGTKLRDATIGVVVEEHAQYNDMKLTSGDGVSVSGTQLNITNTTHYITSGFAAGNTTILGSSQTMARTSGSLAAGATVLATVPGGTDAMLAVIERGGALYGGGTAAGRRVFVPWGNGPGAFGAMNSTGQSLMRRSLEWASASGDLLFVVANAASLSSDAQAHKTLFENWGWTVSLIQDSASQDAYNEAMADADVVFVTQEVSSGNVGTKLTGATIGVVTEENALFDDFGLTSQSGNTGAATDSITITDNSHYLTDEFGLGALAIMSAAVELSTRHGTMGPGATTLANYTGGIGSAFNALEAGAETATGGAAAWRRVFLPWGPNSNSFASLNASGKVLLWRSLMWASAKRYEYVSLGAGFYPTTSTDDDWGSGTHWGDIDGDGDVDAIIGGDSGSKRLVNNAGSFASSAFGTGGVYRQGALLDIDNDGDLDYWGMSHYNTEASYINNGAGSFSSGGDLGLPNPTNMEGVAAADVDGDGWCDVVMFAENGNWIGHNQGTTPASLVGTIDSLYGMNDSGDYGNGDFCSSADVNNDGYPDFFYHYSGGKLFLSNGDGTYTQNNYGISVFTGNDDKFGSAWGDYDNDGDVDLWVSRRDAGYTGYLWRNDVNWEAGTGSFTNQTSAAGIANTTGKRGCAWGDYDNDGDLDLILATADASTDSVLYRNEGDGTFLRVEEGVDVPGDAHDVAFVDYDNDGDLDVSFSIEDKYGALLVNSTDSDAYLMVRVLGAGEGKTNRAAVGVRVELWSSDGSTYLGRREIGVARGYGGTEPMWAHFGGVDPDQTYLVRVYFTRGYVYSGSVTPGAASTTIGATTIAQMVTIDESLVRNSARVVQWDEVAPH
mgnify:CR=1 FL=1